VPDLPKAACALLDKEYVRSTSVVEKSQTSKDCSTCKLLVRLQDGLQVEAVVMTYDKEGELQIISCCEHPPYSFSLLLVDTCSGPCIGASRSAFYDTSILHAAAGDGESEDGHAVLGQQRSTLCVSSQVGCQMGCTFCATGEWMAP